MSESFDIQNLLQAGYFTTTRAKTGQTPSLRSPTPPLSRSPPTYKFEMPGNDGSARPSRRNYPPPPSVEDETVSLAKEYGSSRSTPTQEDAQSRGEIEQEPIIMDVHEYNPERRFVLLGDSDDGADAAASNKTPKPRAKQSPVTSDDGRLKTDPARRREPEPNGRTGNGEKRVPLERRRSRQDLPPLETDMKSDRTKHHSRTQSAATANPGDYFNSNRQSRHFGDQMLSPDIVKAGSGRRERQYYGSGSSARPRSPGPRPQPSRKDDRKYEDDPERRGSAQPPSRRSTSNVESSKSRRRMSNDTEGRYRDDRPPRSSTREQSKDYRRSDRDRSKPPPAYKAREDSRSSDEYSQTPRTAGRRRAKSIIIQDDREPMLSPSVGNGGPRGPRSRSRAPRPPLSPKPTGFPEEMMNPKVAAAAAAAGAAALGAAAVPVFETERSTTRERPTSYLPYPDDEPLRSSRVPLESEMSRAGRPARAASTFAMPDLPVAPELATQIALSPPISTSGQSWPPQSFDPERDGMRVDNTMGSYRRYSESNGANGTSQLPECPRIIPVAGKVDWLTLPRTDFNICPSCYETVFARSEYRTHFQPMLRQTDKPIACDFGSSPWYRIAWLLTLKNQSPDLRLFHQIATVMSTFRAQACPGTRKSTRPWLTVRDPNARRAIRDFTVCSQCAKIVEALLPNLTGVFVPVDSRSEPTRGVCALHFTPERRQFVLYFDALETTSEKALVARQAPDIGELAAGLERLCVTECRKDNPIPDEHWHKMQYLPEFTVCAQCFEEAVVPRLGEESVVARNFYTKRQKLPLATCQLYSPRMREIFRKACQRNDPKYLEDKVRERMQVEADIHAKLVKLDRAGHDEAWTEEQVAKLVREWQKWE